jgi:hypothetical protein
MHLARQRRGRAERRASEREPAGNDLSGAERRRNNVNASGDTYTVSNSAVELSFADAARVLNLDEVSQFAATIGAHQASDVKVVFDSTTAPANTEFGSGKVSHDVRSLYRQTGPLRYTWVRLYPAPRTAWQAPWADFRLKGGSGS